METKIKSKVIEITPKYISLLCLIDEKNKVYELRDFFDVDVFKEMGLKINDFVDIEIIIFHFHQINFSKSKNDYTELFIKRNMFENIPDNFFKPLPIDTEDDF